MDQAPVNEGLRAAVSSLEQWHARLTAEIKSHLARRQASRSVNMRASIDKQLDLLTARRITCERGLAAVYALAGGGGPPGTAPDDSSAS